MTPDDLASWMRRMNYNRSRAASELGCTRDRLRAMLKGEAAIPRYIALACSAIAFGLPPYRGEGAAHNASKETK